jgi:IMP cyclohydrolase
MKLEEIAVSNKSKLGQNVYPGRGIVIGMTPDGNNYVQVYWIMGRSSNSRNRIFEMDGSFMRTKAFDESKLEDPSLIIYYPIKSHENYHIVTNGDQTDTIYDFIKAGKSFESALNTRTFEPDFPNCTPRISGLIDLNSEGGKYSLSILKSINNDKELSQRNYYNYENFIKGIGHCIHTYNEDGNPIPSFCGEPYVVTLDNDIEKNTEVFWKLLNQENKVSLIVKYINVDSKNVSFKIINKNV